MPSLCAEGASSAIRAGAPDGAREGRMPSLQRTSKEFRFNRQGRPQGAARRGKAFCLPHAPKAHRWRSGAGAPDGAREGRMPSLQRTSKGFRFNRHGRPQGSPSEGRHSAFPMRRRRIVGGPGPARLTARGKAGCLPSNGPRRVFGSIDTGDHIGRPAGQVLASRTQLASGCRGGVRRFDRRCRFCRPFASVSEPSRAGTQLRWEGQHGGRCH